MSESDGGNARVVRRTISAQRGLIEAAEVVDSTVARGSSLVQGGGRAVRPWGRRATLLVSVTQGLITFQL